MGHTQNIKLKKHFELIELHILKQNVEKLLDIWTDKEAD